MLCTWQHKLFAGREGLQHNKQLTLEEAQETGEDKETRETLDNTSKGTIHQHNEGACVRERCGDKHKTTVGTSVVLNVKRHVVSAHPADSEVQKPSFPGT